MSERTKGATSVSLEFRLADATTGAAKMALDVTTLKLQYHRPGEAPGTATSLTALAAATTGWTSYGAREVDGTNSPGVYRVDAPNAAFATGADEVVLTVTGSAIQPASRLIDLVAVNTRDAVRFGLSSLPNAAAAASGGLPTIGATIPNATAGSSGGLFIAGTNAATTVTTSFTTTFTGNLSGSVGSVTSPVTVGTNNDKTGYSAAATNLPTKYPASLAAADVTGTIPASLSGTQTFAMVGNITGNVSGSVGSVTGAVGSVTGNVGGNVSGSVGSVSGDVAGKVLGGGSGTITGIGANAYLASIDPSLKADGTAQGGTSNTITLASSALSANGAYLNYTIRTVGGTGSGQGPFPVTGYVGSSRVATIAGTFSPAPSTDTLYIIDAPVNANLYQWLGVAPNALSSGKVDATASVSLGSTAPANWINGAAIATDAVTKVQAGLATASQIPANFTTATFASAGVFSTGALANAPTGGGGSGGLDAAGVRAAIGLASANIDTQFGLLPKKTELVQQGDPITLPTTPPTGYATSTAVAAVKADTGKLAGLVENVSSTDRFKASALATAPTGSSGSVDPSAIVAAILAASVESGLSVQQVLSQVRATLVGASDTTTANGSVIFKKAGGAESHRQTVNATTGARGAPTIAGG